MAREKAEEARKLLARDIDPSAHRKAAKAALANTFEAVADEWLAGQVGQCSPSTHAKSIWVLKLVQPYLGSMPIDKITPLDCIAALKKVAAQGRLASHHETNRREAGQCSSLRSRLVLSGDPTASLAGLFLPGLLQQGYAPSDPPPSAACSRPEGDGSQVCAAPSSCSDSLGRRIAAVGVAWMMMPPRCPRSDEVRRGTAISSQQAGGRSYRGSVTAGGASCFFPNRSPGTDVENAGRGVVGSPMSACFHGFRSSFSTRPTGGLWRPDIVRPRWHGDEDAPL
jgi:hypothetical protein